MAYDITTTIGKVRLRIGDTDSTAEMFADAEIQYFLDVTGNDVVKTAVKILRSVLTQIMIQPQRTKIGNYEIEERAMFADTIRALLGDLEAESTGGIEVGSLATTSENARSYIPDFISVDDTEDYASI